MVRNVSGFEYQAERPDAADFMHQKWGWRATEPGSWAELELDTRADDGAGADTVVWLAYLRSYQGMGTALISCVSGCTCEPAVLDGTWQRRASLFWMTRFPVSGSEVPACRCCLVHGPAVCSSLPLLAGLPPASRPLPAQVSPSHRRCAALVAAGFADAPLPNTGDGAGSSGRVPSKGAQGHAGGRHGGTPGPGPFGHPGQCAGAAKREAAKEEEAAAAEEATVRCQHWRARPLRCPAVLAPAPCKLPCTFLSTRDTVGTL